MPECGYCRDCRHWKEHVDGREEYVDGLKEHWGECKLTEDAIDLPVQQTLASVFYGNGEYGILFTTPTFGCIQWGAIRDV